MLCVAFEVGVVCTADKDVSSVSFLIAAKTVFDFCVPMVDSGISHSNQAGYLSAELIVIHKTTVAFILNKFGQKKKKKMHRLNSLGFCESLIKKQNVLYHSRVYESKAQLSLSLPVRYQARTQRKTFPTHLFCGHERWSGFYFLLCAHANCNTNCITF